MTGRIRSIKPEIIQDAITAGLSHPAFRLYIGTLVSADDWASFRADGLTLYAQVFHRCPLPGGPADLEALLAELTCPKAEARPGLVELYCVHGQRYGTITGWFEHQKISHPGAPKLPSPLQADEESVREHFRQRLKFHKVSGAEILARLAGKSPKSLRRAPENLRSDLDLGSGIKDLGSGSGNRPASAAGRNGGAPPRARDPQSRKPKITAEAMEQAIAERAANGVKP